MRTAQDMFEQAFPTGLQRDLVYLAVPITTGLREFVVMDGCGVRGREDFRAKHEDAWREQVFGPNVRHAHAYAVQAEALIPAGRVLNPAAFDVPGWEQEDYATLWDYIIRTRAKRVAAAPTWAFSRGARREIDLALKCGKPVVDLFGRPLSAYQLQEEALRARSRLLADGWAGDEIDAMLPAIDLRPFKDGPLTHAQKINRRSSEIFAWIANERNDEIQAGYRDDEQWPLRDGLSPSGPWCTQLDDLYNQAASKGLDEASARADLARYVVIGCALLERVVQAYGPLPKPAQARGKQEPEGEWRDLRPEVAGDKTGARLHVSEYVTAWLCSEREYVLEKYHSNEDDGHTRKSGLGGHWKNQLRYYREAAEQEGFETKKGRQWLAKFVATAMGCLESVDRVHGGSFSSLSRTIGGSDEVPRAA